MSEPHGQRGLGRDSARTIRRFHFGAMLFWVVMAPVTLLTGLKSSVPYVALISVYALVVGHAASWAAESAAVAAENAHEDADHARRTLDKQGTEGW